MPQFFIISTGTEFTTGHSQEGNGRYLAAELVDAGYCVAGMATLPDDPKFQLLWIRNLLDEIEPECVILTGGLGATEDDHTVDVLAQISGRGISEDGDTLQRLETHVRLNQMSTKIELLRRQARFLTGSTILKNPNGFAPGMLFSVKNRANREIQIAALPGVPSEMKPMFQESLLPEIKRLFPGRKTARKLFYLYGMGETTFQGKFFSPETKAILPPDFNWGISAKMGFLRVNFVSESAPKLENLCERAKALFPMSFASAPAELLLHEYCSNRRLRIGFAESCTGGLLGKKITDLSGSSAYFQGSVVSYSNDVKKKILGVSAETLSKSGAVSPECATEMALGALRALDCDFAVSVTGIAGPGGGSGEKPVGTVHLACAGKNRGSISKQILVKRDRESIREHAANIALFYLYSFIAERE